MSEKKDNPILKILAAEKSKRAADEAQMRVDIDRLQQKLCDWIREAGRRNIKIKDRSDNCVWIEVVNPTGPAFLWHYGGTNGKYSLGDMFCGLNLNQDVLAYLRNIVSALEKGTAYISAK